MDWQQLMSMCRCQQRGCYLPMTSPTLPISPSPHRLTQVGEVHIEGVYFGQSNLIRI